MRAGAELIGIAHGVPDAADWERISGELAQREGLAEGLLIAQLTGGTAARTHLPAARSEPTFFAYLRSYRFPRAEQAAAGIAAITTPDVRWARCDLKTTMLLPAVLAKRAAAAAGASEAIFVGQDGVVHEGASSNLFLVEADRIVTPAQSEHLLPGITRPVVARLARDAGFDVADAEIPIARVHAADEVFVTSTTFGVMPVISLDGTSVSAGRAGPIAIDLAARLRAELEL
jgi:D-alanine transaminase